MLLQQKCYGACDGLPHPLLGAPRACYVAAALRSRAPQRPNTSQSLPQGKLSMWHEPRHASVNLVGSIVAFSLMRSGQGLAQTHHRTWAGPLPSNLLCRCAFAFACASGRLELVAPICVA